MNLLEKKKKNLTQLHQLMKPKYVHDQLHAIGISFIGGKETP